MLRSRMVFGRVDGVIGAAGSARSSPSTLLAHVALLGAIASAPGCAGLNQWAKNGLKVGPEYVQPEAAVARQWIDADDVRVSTAEPDLAHWWSVFRDPTLDELVMEACRQNITLREAGARVLEARAVLGIAVGEFFPQKQGAEGSFSWSRVSDSAFDPLPIDIPDRSFNRWDVGFGLSWELDFWGRFRRSIDAAQDELDASVANYDDAIVTLVSDVATRYIEIRTLQRRRELVVQNEALQQQTLDIARAKFEGGDVSELDVDQATLMLARTRAEIPLIDMLLRIENTSLCVLLGIPAVDLAPRLGIGSIPTAPPEIVVGVPKDLLRRRPDVRRAERLAAAASERIGIAEADFYPAISISGSFGVSADSFVDLFSGSATRGSFGPSFTWKLLDYGRTASNVRRHQAGFDRAVAAYEQTVLRANAEVENGMARFLESQERLRILGEAVEVAKKAVDIALVQYREGVVDFNRVALLEQDLLRVEEAHAAARGDVARGLVDTYRALGGGWQIREVEE